jgi:hypothetical protein
LVSPEKSDHPISYSRLSHFGSFENRNKEGAKLEDLKIQGALRHEKRVKGIKEPRWEKFKPKAEAAKIGLFGFGYRNI